MKDGNKLPLHLQKIAAARAAIDYIKDMSINVIGVGTGSTVDCFIDNLVDSKIKIEGAVSSSERTEKKLRKIGIPILDMNQLDELPVYVDGADEIDEDMRMIKGGGGALTREKVVASFSKEFICIADSSKRVTKIGNFPVAVEVLAMARSYVSRKIVKMGGRPTYRCDFLTDNGNIIIDVVNLTLSRTEEVERELKCIVGVLENGLFCLRRADVLFLGMPDGLVKIFKR